MFRNRFVSLALVLLGTGSFVLGAAACSDDWTGPPEQIEVEGTVLSSHDSSPISGVHVYVSSTYESGSQPETWTDEHGYYLLTCQTECFYGVRITAAMGNARREKEIACADGMRQVRNFFLSVRPPSDPCVRPALCPADS